MGMDIFFPEDHLQRTVPEDTRILALRAAAYPDGTRVRVEVETTDFQKRPYLEFVLTNGSGEEVASVAIVEPLTWKLEFTMHLRGGARNPHTLQARLYYPDGPAAAPETC